MGLVGLGRLGERCAPTDKLKQLPRGRRCDAAHRQATWGVIMANDHGASRHMGLRVMSRLGHRFSAARLGLLVVVAAVPGSVCGQAAHAANLVSDDFATQSLDPLVWSFVDPRGDASIVMTGTHAQIVVPATGAAHDVWTNGNFLPRLVQVVEDTDLRVEVKFESGLTGGFQSQGILIEQDAENVVRAEFHYGSGQTRVFVATIFNHSASIKAIKPVPLSPPMYLRVQRSGEQWTVGYSVDGWNWTTAATFAQAMTASAVSVFAGNGDETPHTAFIDYFFDSGAPVDPEDGGLKSIMIGAIGGGAISRVPNAGGYASGEVVELTAVPEAGWEFDQWSGDLVGIDNPLTVTITDDLIATAWFVRAADAAPPQISGVNVVAERSTATITWTTDEPATSVVDYGLNASYTDSVWDLSLVSAHSLVLTGLAPETVYHFQVVSEDATGNVSTSTDATFETAPNAGPTIDLWYGSRQIFGDPGVTQRWVNILGNVSDPDGIWSVVYSLNGGPEQQLSMGPDTRRLSAPGDFNVEIATTDLASGLNEVVITATDWYLTTTMETVTVDYVTDGIWPEPYTIDWSTVTNIQDVAQVVDGLWTIENGSLRPVVMGYDRVVAVGDVAWADYEVTVPVTMHALDPAGYLWPSVSPGFGLTLRWPGHTAWDDAQPTWGWRPAGAGVWYDAGYDGPLSLGGDDGLSQSDPFRTLEYDVRYIFKMRVQTVPGQGTFYAVKVWEDGGLEPAEWDLAGMEGLSEVPSGSCALTAHHTDVSFGNVTIIPLADSEPPQVSGTAVASGATSAAITWTTDEPTTSVLDYGLTTDYAESVSDTQLRISHSITLAGLEPETLYHCRIVAEDTAGNVAVSEDLTFSTSATVSTGVVSDDFSGPDLDTSIWTFINPFDDASVAMTGSQAQIVIPATGGTHDVWVYENFVPRLMQAVEDTDFEVEAKFDSPLDQGFQSQGILIEQDPDHVIRVEFHYYGGGTNIYAATILGPSATTRIFQSVPLSTPMYLRMGRSWDNWMIAYSLDGANWTTATTFTQSITVNAVGVFAGNGADTPHTAIVDYFFDTASPIEPEDGDLLTVTVDVIGSGQVLRDPDLGGYPPGSVVELTAIPEPGYVFDRWSGDVADTINPITLTVTDHLVVTAVFLEESDLTPPVIADINVVAAEIWATITWATDEPATSLVDYGLTTSYTNSVSDPALETSHSITLTGLDPDTLYHFEIVCEDTAGNLSTSGDLTLTTTAAVPSVVVSDDFSSPDLNTGVWTFVDPLDDASVVMTGSQAQIVIPATGQVHDVWTHQNFVPRLMQAVDDTDFEVEAKFESALTEGFQSQGILIEQDPDDVIRVEFHYYGGQTKLFAATIFGDSATTRKIQSLSLSVPMYLRVGRSGHGWTVRYSLDGSSWTTAATFTQSMTVNAVGVFAGNAADTPHTATVDYFFDTASPIEPEDSSLLSVTVDVVGQGSVLRNPDLSAYTLGSVVELTAVAESSWVFDHWSGDLTGGVNPTSLSITDHVVVTAVFVQEEDVTPPLILDIDVGADETSATITWITDEPATSVVDYGMTESYVDSVSDRAFTTVHSVVLTGLDPDTLYHFEIVSEDLAGNVAGSGDLTFWTVELVTPGITSDGFDSPELDSEVWTFVNPLDDASVMMTGSQAQIVIPANGQVHDVWTYQNYVPRLMQTVDDTDFDVEAKFDSVISEGFQSQGLLIEEDPDHVVRVEFHYYSGQTKVFAATIFGDTATIRTIRTLPLTAPMYLRVSRSGDWWTVKYSLNGTTWTTATIFTQPMTVSVVGVFAGNGGDTPHTATIDYFIDTTSPVTAKAQSFGGSAFMTRSKQRIKEWREWRGAGKDDQYADDQ